jgi:hypothetical protein
MYYNSVDFVLLQKFVTVIIKALHMAVEKQNFYFNWLLIEPAGKCIARP